MVKLLTWQSTLFSYETDSNEKKPPEKHRPRSKSPSLKEAEKHKSTSPKEVKKNVDEKKKPGINLLLYCFNSILFNYRSNLLFEMH